ncbi:MAG: SUMF1/EgtB/PvdO family nonheme iron enzyme [Nitrospinota bacterium]|nr:SUMF1/EgtB/PvdO family nonheme iron enzyme [Nitrospinota bacterium]
MKSRVKKPWGAVFQGPLCRLRINPGGWLVGVLVFCTAAIDLPSDRWVTLNGGEFIMGDRFCATQQANSAWCADETPHTVRLDPYAIGKHEVTDTEYNKCVEAEACAPNVLHGTRPRDFTQPHQPVVFVTWQDAVSFCQWVGARLPTEAEWENAAQALELGGAYYGRDYNSASPQDVGKLSPNSRGLYDMLGNVYEWTLDWHAAYETNKILVNPRGPASGKEKVVRGGAWNSPPHFLRVHDRLGRGPHKRFSDVGFRCVKSSP